MSKNKIVQNANSAPIKIVETYPNYKNNVVKGAGICAAIVAVPYKHKKNIEGLPPQVWWRTLLDSGSDGDLLFVTKNKLKTFHMKRGTQPKPGKPQMEHLRQHL